MFDLRLFSRKDAEVNHYENKVAQDCQLEVHHVWHSDFCWVWVHVDMQTVRHVHVIVVLVFSVWRAMFVIRVSFCKLFLVFHSIEVVSNRMECLIKRLARLSRPVIAFKNPRVAPSRHNLQLKLLTHLHIAQVLVIEEFWHQVVKLVYDTAWQLKLIQASIADCVIARFVPIIVPPVITRAAG